MKINTKACHLKTKLGIATLAFMTSTSLYAAPATLAPNCGLTGANSQQFLSPSPAVGASGVTLLDNLTLFPGSSFQTNFPNQGDSGSICFFPSLPTIAQIDSDCDTTVTETDGITNYIAQFHISADTSVQPTYCLYQYDIDFANTADVRTNPVVAVAAANPIPATEVPIFSPLGLLAMLSGMLWFGRRSRKTS